MLSPEKVDTCSRLAFVALVAAFTGLVYFQTVKPLMAARRDLDAFHEAVQILSDAEGSVDRLQFEIRTVAAEIAETEALLPRDLDIDAFLEQLGDIAERAAVRVDQFTPHRARPYRMYRALPLEVHLSGSFPAVNEFLVELDRGSRLTQVERLDLKWSPGLKQCEANMRLALFFARGEVR